jgi:signal transduction histidine kinase
MSARTAAWLSRAILVLSAVAVLVSISIWYASQRSADRTSIVVIGDPSAPRVNEVRAELAATIAGGGSFLPESPNVGFVAVFVVSLGWILVGSLIVSRQPKNWAGWLFVAIGIPLPLLSLSQALVVYGARVEGADVPLLGFWAVLGEYVIYPIGLLPLLFLLFPDGRPPSPGWRWAVRGLLGGVGLAIAAFAVRPGPLNNWVEQGILYVNPIGIDGFAGFGGALIAVGAIVALGAAVSTVVAVRRRFRRSVGEERQQLRWLRFVASAAGISFALQFTLGLTADIAGFEPEVPIFDILFLVTAAILAFGIPAAYLIAIFRYGLWDLDVVIRKTVQYGALVAVFTAMGALAVLAVPTLLFGVGSDISTLPVIVIAAVIAGAFLWLRPRVTRLANRIVYGRRATPYEVLSTFSGRVGETYSIEDVLPRMAQLVAEATGARRVDVWLRVGRELRPEVTWPADAPAHPARTIANDRAPLVSEERGVEVRHQGELLGEITMEPAPDDPMNPSKEALLGDLASQAGLVLRNVRLIEELRASRQRLVAAQDAERRRIERNIHDGVQQQLVALNVQLGLLARAATQDPERAAEMATTLQGRTTSTLEDLRDLARGIYPPLLADKGLGEALTAQARKSAIPVEVETDGIGRYPQAVESAVYFCTLEALNNVAKYADASRVTITVEEDDEHLTFTVSDDGHGFDPNEVGYGTGLQGMADRLDAIGGGLRIDSSSGQGTTVEGSVPIGHPEGRR